jgi:succinoglycan biosynthesis protein ExoA
VIKPLVTVVIPAKNAEKTIEKAIFSALNQKIDGELEICISVAPSTDRTFEIAKRISMENTNVILVKNPSGKTPTGLNLAIQNTKAQVIVRLDAHAELFGENYISKALETMKTTGAANVGGLQKPVGTTPFETAVGKAMSSRFGAGDARFRIGGKSGAVDTVYLGVFDRNSIESIGLFDESLIRNQDAELNWRLRQSGEKVWFESGIAASYKPRSTLKELVQQYFDYGRWRRHVIRVHPRSIKWRQLIPPFNLVTFFVGGILGFLWAPMFIFPTAYLLSVFFVTMAKSKTSKDFIYLMVIFPSIHFSWAAGFLKGIKN